MYTICILYRTRASEEKYLSVRARSGAFILIAEFRKVLRKKLLFLINLDFTDQIKHLV